MIETVNEAFGAGCQHFAVWGLLTIPFALVVSNRYDHLDRRVQKITPVSEGSKFVDTAALIH